jgi:hypothetical protein
VEEEREEELINRYLINGQAKSKKQASEKDNGKPEKGWNQQKGGKWLLNVR